MSDPELGLSALVDDLPVIVWQGDARGRAVTYLSGTVERLLGHPPHIWLADPGFWAEITHPDDREESLRQRWDALADYESIYRVRTAAGDLVWLLEKTRVHGTLRSGVLIDVTARQAADERQRFLDELDHELQRLDDAEDLMALATRMLGEHLGVDRCAYARTEADENHFVMSGGHATGLPPLPGRFAMREFGEGALTAMRAGEPWVVDDSLGDPRLGADDLAAYRVTGIRAVICLPLLRGGRFVAAMAVHQASVRHWTRDEVDLVSVVVNRCWESLQRVHADRALRDSEQRHRRLVERATDAIWLLDQELRFVSVNPATGHLLGYRPDDLLGTAITDLLVDGLPDDLSASEVVTMRHADGTAVALELSIQSTPTGLQAIGRDVTERQRAEAERELLLHREHEIAAALQEGLLPRELPALPRLASAARYLPAARHSQIGGDWYEVVPLGGTRVGLTVGDVVGKGPAAAAVMGQLRSALTGYLLDGHSPAESLRRLDVFATRVNGAVGSTCACIVFDWHLGELCWASAGHPPPVVADGTGARPLAEKLGTVLGVGAAPAPQHSALLPPGASVVLYTDGLVERRGEVLDEGIRRLTTAVGSSSDLAPPALAQRIIDAMLADDQSDDIALVVARHLPAPLRLHVPAQARELAALRHTATTWAALAGLSEDARYDLELAIGEAAANVVDHAYPDGGGTFDTELESTGRGVLVTVTDQGHWRPEPADKGNRGRGLAMIRMLSDDVHLDAGDGGTTIRFHVPATPVPQPSPAPRETTPVLPAARREPAPSVTGLADGIDEDVQRIVLTGDLDIATVEDLRAPLLTRVDVADERPVVLDLTGLAYLSSSGVALLLQATACANERGRALTVVATGGSAPARILDLSGLDHTTEP
ncbi:SpoIIE family protein phosphatase [Nocardia sp. NRRL S-836]|uniref:SpoIIE family protein phosphatase n=1 Tax=Nocardia sp. NRRL S-836 TaxID=1519492 RepID=UPI0006AEB247|nr:SpoIIE family protein phosphatase [Nocardia sp. NRRL S-836]KOV83254.1 PAS/PAC sensor protein [Nocardia sp. NRRL S-836]